MQLISDKTLQDIEESLGLDFLDDKKRSEMMTKIIALISSRAGIRIMKEFSEEDAREFNKIPEESFDEMEKYIISRNPNAPAIFEEEAQKTKEELLNVKL